MAFDYINALLKKEVTRTPIWVMRQAGRYLPEFREIRKKNTDFIKLCLNQSLSAEITLQPLRRFDLDAAIIFSDILMLPYGLGQKVEFEKNFGPKLGELDLKEISKIDEKKLDVYEDYPILYKKYYFFYYGKKVMTYTMVKKSKFRFPTERYLNVVKRGYKNCGLDIKYLQKGLLGS